MKEGLGVHPTRKRKLKPNGTDSNKDSRYIQKGPNRKENTSQMVQIKSINTCGLELRPPERERGEGVTPPKEQREEMVSPGLEKVMETSVVQGHRCWQGANLPFCPLLSCQDVPCLNRPEDK